MEPAKYNNYLDNSVGLGWWILQLHLSKGVKSPPTNMMDMTRNQLSECKQTIYTK